MAAGCQPTASCSTAGQPHLSSSQKGLNVEEVLTIPPPTNMFGGMSWFQHLRLDCCIPPPLIVALRLLVEFIPPGLSTRLPFVMRWQNPPLEL